MTASRFAALGLLFVLAGAGVLHAQNDFRIDVDSTTGGPLSTETGFTSLDATGGNGANVIVNGTTFTVFSADGSRNRGAPNPLTADFIFDDGAGVASGLTINSLPAGIYRANVYGFDNDFTVGDQFVGITRFANGPETIFTNSFADSATDSFSFVFSTDNFPDGSGIFTRENNANNRSRFNALELTQLPLAPSSTQFNIDIDSTTGGAINTEPGFTSLDGTGGNGSNVTVDGVTFTVFSADGSRNRGGSNALTTDFVFDDGGGVASGLTISGLADGIYQADVYSFDDDFTIGDQFVGITQFASGPELIFTDDFAGSADTPFSFVFDSTDLPDGFGIFTRENNGNNRSRFNALTLTLLQQVPEPTSVALWTLLGCACTAFAVWRRRRR